MDDFRKICPSRRNSFPSYKNYKDYKHLLREDFKQRCGYCGDHDFFSETFYEVDHLVPKKQLNSIAENDYSNLVYSCRSCNNSKRAKWPSGDEKVHNDGKIGFIDPCDGKYPIQFDRLSDGSISSKSDIGRWMWKNLNFGNPAHRLKWKLEQLRVILKETDVLDVDDVEQLKRIKQLNSEYRRFEESLRGIPTFQ